MTNYDELAERAERGELALIPGTQRRGHAARAEAEPCSWTPPARTASRPPRPSLSSARVSTSSRRQSRGPQW